MNEPNNAPAQTPPAGDSYETILSRAAAEAAAPAAAGPSPEALDKLKAARSNPAYLDPRHEDHVKVHAEVSALYTEIYGDGDVNDGGVTLDAPAVDDIGQTRKRLGVSFDPVRHLPPYMTQSGAWDNALEGRFLAYAELNRIPGAVVDRLYQAYGQAAANGHVDRGTFDRAFPELPKSVRDDLFEFATVAAPRRFAGKAHAVKMSARK